MLKTEGKISDAVNENMLSWRHSGFNAYCAPTIWPNNDRIDEQWHLTQIHAEQGWDITQGHEDIIIAMLDMGFDTQQIDLQDKLIDGCDATVGDVCGDELNCATHGTWTSGVAAAATDNDEGIAGVAWNCRLMPIRISIDPAEFCTDVKQEDWILKGPREARKKKLHHS